MNILVTGGNGFIGRNIHESYLSEKYNLMAPGRQELDMTDDMAVRGYLKENKIDVIIHSAAKPGHRNASDTSHLLMTNSRMFFNIARNSDYFGKFINIGSGAIYDMRYYQPRMKEDYFDTHVPADEHGYNKYICYKYIELSERIIDFRVFGIFGKYEDYAIRFISNMICKAIFNLPMTMNQNRRFDYLYVEDLMPILDHFIQNDPSCKSYNITPDESVELVVLAEKVKKISGKNIPIIVTKEGYGSEYTGDNSRLHNEIKKLKFTQIDEAIVNLYEWYYNNRNSINMSLLLYDK
jgi:GDP-L-fucose synthase